MTPPVSVSVRRRRAKGHHVACGGARLVELQRIAVGERHAAGRIVDIRDLHERRVRPFLEHQQLALLKPIDAGLNVDGRAGSRDTSARRRSVVLVMAVSGMSTKLLSAISIVMVSVATPLMVGPSPLPGITAAQSRSPIGVRNAVPGGPGNVHQDGAGARRNQNDVTWRKPGSDLQHVANHQIHARAQRVVDAGHRASPRRASSTPGSARLRSRPSRRS